MRASLLTVGDELLIGQVLNSNTQWMSEKVTDLGIEVKQHLSVSDQIAAIQEALDYLIPRSEVIIIGGGLGPTHDDLTIEALSKYTGMPQVFDQDWISKVEAYFKSRNRVMSENNKKQALLLQGAIRIDNDCGTAAGQHFAFKGVEIFVVPGVPHEMKSMMEQTILPALSKKNAEKGFKILKSSLLTTGLGESLLATRLASFVEKVKQDPKLSLAFLPNNIEVKLRLQMKALNESDSRNFENLIQELQTLCGEDYFGREGETLEHLIVTRLISAKQTLALAESCTGGLVSHRLTEISGASSVLRGTLVPYQVDLKTSELQISKTHLETYGVVSEQTARLMAESIRNKWGTSLGLATTGYLGPSGGDAFATVGTVWMAVTNGTETLARSFHYENHRARAKERASQSALDLLRRFISA